MLLVLNLLVFMESLFNHLDSCHLPKPAVHHIVCAIAMLYAMKMYLILVDSAEIVRLLV